MKKQREQKQKSSNKTMYKKGIKKTMKINATKKIEEI